MTTFLAIWSAATLAGAIMKAVTYLDEPKRRARR